MRRLATMAGTEKQRRPHGLRHSFAVEPERAGTPVTAMSSSSGAPR
jgi:site-specific recombinase XerD